jgi:hypothetical protein
MASNPTKILLYDLDADLGKLMDDLKKLQGEFPTLYDRLTKIGVDLLDEDTKRVVQDLINGYSKTSKLTVKRIEDLEYMLQVALTDGKDGSEKFTYDPTYQNVTKHEVKDTLGSVLFTVDYEYVSLESGKLKHSIKTFKDAEKNTVEVKKVYTYDLNDNITDIVTTTTKTPPVVPTP